MKLKERRRSESAVVKFLKLLSMSFGIVLMVTFLTPLTCDDAMAAGHGSDQGKGQMIKGQGGQGGQGGQATGSKSGAKGVKGSVFAAEEEGDDDSDAPDWAKGNRDLNPHAQGGGQPDGSGTKKGDEYGDLWVVFRDAVSGLPIFDENDNVQPIATWPYEQALDEDEEGMTNDEGYPIFLDIDGNPVLEPDGSTVYKEGLTTLIIQLSEEGDVPTMYEPYLQEVEFGRLSVGRSPNKVTDKSLDEAMTKLDAGETIEFDAAGRIVIDGSTIDSPLENLALYTAIMTKDANLLALLPEEVTSDPVKLLDLAASLLAAAADKTGSINIDLVAYQNIVLGISTADNYYDYSGDSYDYDRETTYTSTEPITFYYQTAVDGPVLLSEPMTVYEAVFNSTPSVIAEGITDFAQAADDALQVIDFMHTQIHFLPDGL